jgi:two-component system chemotaxis response regulator CheB
MQTAAAPAEQVLSENRIRVMIVDDSAVVRGLVARWIDEEPGLEVVARHANGKLAVEDVASSAPDVILLDVEMPVMDGLEALPLLLRIRPEVRVLVVSTHTRRNAELSLHAMTLGAFDCVPKPDSNREISTLPNFRAEIIRKVKVLAAGRPRAKAPREVVARPIAPVRTRGYSLVPPRVVVIGSSTGGPPALTAVLEALSPSLDSIPVLIAQHMPAMFTAVLAERLARATGRETKEGADGELLQPGTVYVAPGNHHMTISRGGPPRLSVKKGPPVHFCRPAIDPLFATAAAVFGPATLAIVLTGMGQDGAAGALAVANAGGSVIAQDEASSVVWGMPGATAAAGACAALLPPLKIAQVTAKLIAGERA